MRIQGLGHRYLMKQSMSFYQDEFAGRVATKLMQTALALGGNVLATFIEIVNYVVVYWGCSSLSVVPIGE